MVLLKLTAPEDTLQTKLIEWRGKPEVIRIDNGPEFTSAVFEAWAENIKSSSASFSQASRLKIV